MIIMRRPIYGWGIHNHTPVHITGGFPGRPCDSYTASLASFDYSMSGPQYKGMDPSDPMTWTRQYNPVGGMISYLNFDGAALQGRTPTGLQGGSQSRKPRRLRIGP